MKFLILSCSTGEGHNSAARAAQEILKKHGHEAIVRDPVSFGGERAKNTVAGLYNNLIEHTPKVFGYVYKVGALVEKIPGRSVVYAANTLYAEKLGAYIREEKFDAALYSHLYGGEALTYLRLHGLLDIPVFGILTDYTVQPFFTETVADRYFIGHADLAKELADRKTDPSLIRATGIPVSLRFDPSLQKDEAREKLGIPADIRLYLVMTGGVGCGKIRRITEALLEREGEDARIVVLSGRSKKLYREITEAFQADPRVTAVSFTKDVQLYAAASDVTITKPGGLSTTELAVLRVPMVHLIAMHGCETKNAEFFSERNLSVYAKNVKDAAEKAVFLATHPAETEGFRKRLAEMIPGTPAENVYREIMEVMSHE